MGGKQCVALLLALIVVSEGNVVKTNSLARWDFGLSANINDYVDDTIGMLIPFLETHGLDPMPLPDMIDGFAVKPLLITYSAWVKFYDGSMTGMVNMARYGDQKVNYFAKMLRVRIEVEITDVQFNYKYLIKVMNIGPTGGIRGSLNRFTVVTDVLLDFNNDEIHLQQLSLQNIGRLRVRLTGNILTDWLVNPLIGVFVRIFDNTIIRIVESNIVTATHAGITEINARIRDVINVLESYN